MKLALPPPVRMAAAAGDAEESPWTLHPFLAPGDEPQVGLWYVVSHDEADNIGSQAGGEEGDGSSDERSQNGHQGDLPCCRLGHGCAITGPGTMIVAGGASATGLVQDAHSLDTKTLRWTRLGGEFPSRYEHMTTCVDGKVFVAAGATPDKNLNDVHMYDPGSSNHGSRPAPDGHASLPKACS